MSLLFSNRSCVLHPPQSLKKEQEVVTTVLPDRDVENKDETPQDPSGPRIRCPLCGWTPSKNSRWMCTCRHVWNTFDTGGVCPACLYQWKITACLRCHRWSRHSDWYTHR